MEGLEHWKELNKDQWSLFMFVSLAQQTECWSYMLKDKLNHRSKQIFNTYLNSAKSLWTHLVEKNDLDDLLDDSAVFSDLLEMMMKLPLHKQQALYIALKEFVNGNIKIEDDENQPANEL
jgi:hypothetical protein